MKELESRWNPEQKGYEPVRASRGHGLWENRLPKRKAPSVKLGASDTTTRA